MKNGLTSIFLFLIFCIVYFLGSFSKIPFGDCMGFVVDTEKGIFITEVSPTSHFLYINTAILLKKIAGWNAILTNRLLVVFSAAVVVLIVYKTVILLTAKDWIALTTSIVFGFSFTFWKNAEIVEVYSFNMLWISLFLYYVIKAFFKEKGVENTMVLAGLFLSVSLWAHIQNIFFIPSYIIFLFYFRKNKKALVRSALLLCLSFTLMFALNALENLPPKTVFSSNQGNWVANSFHKSTTTYLKDLLQSVAYLLYNFNIFTVFGFMGAHQLYLNSKKLFYIIAPSAILFYGFATFYAVSDNYVFFLPFNIIFALGIALGLKKLQHKRPVRILSPVCLLIPLFYLGSYHFLDSVDFTKNFRDLKAYKGGLNYYVLPWMNNNVGILEFTIEEREASDEMFWMTNSAKEYTQMLLKKGFTVEEIKKL